MWANAFQVSTQRVTDALLRKPVLPGSCSGFERVSGAIAVRHALAAKERGTTLVFQVPQVTVKTARHIAAALLVGNHAHSFGAEALPAQESRPLIRGDILFVTAAVSDGKDELDRLPIGTYQHLTDYWEVIPFSRYTSSRPEKPRVFVANPGWMLKGTAGRRFGAVIIDASHPRTYEGINELVRSAQGCTDIRIAVTPPLGENTLKAIGYPTRATVWLWDPQAIADAELAISDKHVEALDQTRTLLVCDSDPDASAALDRLHRTLAATVKASSGQFYPGLATCWSIYNRLRQLVVSLAALEQKAAHSWARSLRSRVDSLDEVDGFGTVAWETTWPALRDAVKNAYQVMLKREETAKFWALASCVGEFLESDESRLRIVVPTELECEMAVAKLDEVLDGFVAAVANGRIDVVTPSQEARLIAEGFAAPTCLLGSRTDGYRYLDVFPSNPVDQLLYPHEVSAVRAQQARLYKPIEPFCSDGLRKALLEPLGLRSPNTSEPAKSSRRPVIRVAQAINHDVKVAIDANLSVTLDVDEILDAPPIGPRAALQPSGGTSYALSGDVVEVVYRRGEATQFYAGHSVDVVFSETGEVRRYPVTELQPGMFVISFVDDRYDGLFRRLTEVVNSRLAASQRMALDLWATVKDGLAEKYPNRKELFDKLRLRGLASTYESFTTWFREGDDEVLAPQQLADFRVLATESNVFKSESLLMTTFDAIRHTRGRNRATGRKLRKFLRAVVTNDGYDEALESARKLDAALGDVLAAVEVLEVALINRIQRRQ